MQNELKPCPFCGGEAKIGKISIDKTYYVQCGNGYCDVLPSTYTYTTEEQAIEHWNRRVDNAE